MELCSCPISTFTNSTNSATTVLLRIAYRDSEKYSFFVVLPRDVAVIQRSSHRLVILTRDKEQFHYLRHGDLRKYPELSP
jgi:hypothetical protein